MNNGHNLIQGGGDWTNVIIPGDAQNSGFNHKMTYEVSNLKTDAEYECLVQARNQFGWSEASRIFHFYTGKRGKFWNKSNATHVLANWKSICHIYFFFLLAFLPVSLT